jgi:hypothetical protein
LVGHPRPEIVQELHATFVIPAAGEIKRSNYVEVKNFTSL